MKNIPIFALLVLVLAGHSAESEAAAETVTLWRVSIKVLADPGGSWPRDTGDPLTTGPQNRGDGIPLLIAGTDEGNRSLRTIDATQLVDLAEIIELPDLGEWNKRPWSSHESSPEPCESMHADLEAAAKADKRTYAWRDDAINVYYVNCASTIAGGLAPYPENGDIVIITPRAGKDTLTHEIGHHLSLRHTHHGVGNVDCGGISPEETINLTPGEDGLASTLPDHPCYTIDDLSIRAFGVPWDLLYFYLSQFFGTVPGHGSMAEYGTRLVRETFENVMSYHPGGDRFTAEQMARMRMEAESSRINEIKYARLRSTTIDPHLPFNDQQQLRSELPKEFYGDWVYKSGAQHWADWVSIREEHPGGGKARYYADIDSSFASYSGYALQFFPSLYGDALIGTPVAREGQHLTYTARINEFGNLVIRIASYQKDRRFLPFLDKAVELRRPTVWDYRLRGKDLQTAPARAEVSPITGSLP